MSNVEMRLVNGEEARSYFAEISEMRIEAFAKFPYLQEINLDADAAYLERYFSSENSRFVMLFNDQKKVVGIGPMIPLNEEVEDFVKPFIAANLDPNNYLYAECIIAEGYRGLSVVGAISRMQEQYAKDISKPFVSFLVFDREDDERSKYHRKIASIWRFLGGNPLNGLVAERQWRRSDTKRVDKHLLHVWAKQVA